jgi:hypothetical protein
MRLRQPKEYGVKYWAGNAGWCWFYNRNSAEFHHPKKGIFTKAEDKKVILTYRYLSKIQLVNYATK